MSSNTQRRRSNGEGSIWWDDRRQRYVGQITVRDDSGATRRRTVVATTQAELAKRLEQLRTNAAAGVTAVATEQTVAQFLAHWRTNVLPLEDLRPNTIRSYGETIRLYINPYVGAVPLATLQPRHVEHMMRSLVAKGYSGSVVSKARKILARALRVALRDQLVTRNVAALVDGVSVPRSKGKTLDPAQAAALLRTADAEGHFALVAVMVGLGLRRQEALGLRWAEIDLDSDHPTLTVNGVIARNLDGVNEFSELTKTSSSRRRLHLPDAIVTALRKHRRAQHRQRIACVGTWARDWPHDDFVFTTTIGTPLDLMRVTRLITRLAADAGLGHWSPHDLRHSAASLLMASGVSLKEVSDTLGHSSIRVTADVYGHLMEPARRAAAEAMQAAIFS